MNNSISRTLYEIITRHIILYTVFVALPAALFLFIDYFGKTAGFYDSSNVLTTFGNWSILGSILVSFLLIVAKGFADKYDSEVTNNGIIIANKLLFTTKDTKESKYSYYKGFISDTNKLSICKYMAPRQEITRLLRRFRSTLSEITGIAHNQIGLSLFYKYCHCPYERISTENIDSDPNVIIGKQNSTITFMIKENISFVFFPDKRTAISKNQYVSGSKDKAYNSIGSIYCEEIKVSHNSEVYIEAYLSITTYGIQLCKENDHNSMDKFSHIVIPVLTDQLKIELSKLYIVEKKKCPNRRD